MNTDAITPQDMRFNPPSFDAAEVAGKVADEYGLIGEWALLEGERDQNFRLRTEDGRKFVVKIAGPAFSFGKTSWPNLSSNGAASVFTSSAASAHKSLDTAIPFDRFHGINFLDALCSKPASAFTASP